MLTDLQPDTLYEFTLTAIGPGGSKQTQETFVFHTFPNGLWIIRHINVIVFIDQIPELLIVGNEGIIRSDPFGNNPTYVSRSETVGSSGKY